MRHIRPPARADSAPSHRKTAAQKANCLLCGGFLLFSALLRHAKLPSSDGPREVMPLSGPKALVPDFSFKNCSIWLLTQNRYRETAQTYPQKLQSETVVLFAYFFFQEKVGQSQSGGLSAETSRRNSVGERPVKARKRWRISATLEYPPRSLISLIVRSVSASSAMV